MVSIENKFLNILTTTHVLLATMSFNACYTIDNSTKQMKPRFLSKKINKRVANTCSSCYANCAVIRLRPSKLDAILFSSHHVTRCRACRYRWRCPLGNSTQRRKYKIDAAQRLNVLHKTDPNERSPAGALRNPI